MAKLSIHVFGFNLSAEVSKARTSYDMSREMADSIKKVVAEQIRKEGRLDGLLYKGRGDL
ncbi:MAG: hypothetical protein BAX61_02945 [Psychrobacter sp. B29-1]|uniref:hypothetical protein n=1 Tax=Psychrobacter sp. B29-1 TaxID=1867800 RepID=UPI0008684133|nr:hypothetical protein [Psychrobacter sp. B29-1]OEH69157.1 MAG: hypothetical protein BAX61_02945 [Psychrobacter sp. B29-1]